MFHGKFRQASQPTDGPKPSQAAAGSAGCGQDATDTTGQSEGNASSLCPGAWDHSPRYFPASGCSGCFIGPSTGWELSLPPAPYRQTLYRRQIVVCLPGQAILRTMVGTTLQRSPHALQGQIQTKVLFPSPRTTNLNTVGDP